MQSIRSSDLRLAAIFEDQLTSLDPLENKLKQIFKEIEIAKESSVPNFKAMIIEPLRIIFSRLEEEVDSLRGHLDGIIHKFTKQSEEKDYKLHIIMGIISQLEPSSDIIENQLTSLTKEFEEKDRQLRIVRANEKSLQDKTASLELSFKKNLIELKDLEDDHFNLSHDFTSIQESLQTLVQ